MAEAPSPFRVLGLDPGSLRTGYGVIEADPPGTKAAMVAQGVIKAPAQGQFPQRLEFIFKQLQRIIAQYSPVESAVEGVYTHRNARTALILGQARGVAVLAVSLAGIALYEYPPASVKKALVGVGRASKEQVRAMVQHLLDTNQALELDASDALAVALTHLHSRTLAKRLFL